MNRKQHIVYSALLLAVLFLANGTSIYGQGKLGRVREAVRHSKPATPSQNNSHDDHGDHDDDGDDHRPHQNHDRPSRKSGRNDRGHRHSRNRSRSRARNSGLEILIGSVCSPPVNEVHVVHHTPAPVIIAEPTPVYQPVVAPIIDQPIIESNYFENSASSFDWGVRLTAVGGTDFDDIAHGSFGLLLQIPGGLGIDSSVTMLRESGMDFRDHLYLGDVNLVYEPIATDNFRMRIGVGINWLGDSVGGDAGFNMTSGFDLRITDRLLATGEIDFGSIGDTDITHAQISLGREISPNTEWTVGYDNLDIGGVTISSTFTGFRFRF